MRRFGTMLMMALLVMAVTAPAGAEPSYKGSKACKKCHMKQYKSWQQTKMAAAFNTLKAGEAAEAKTKAKLDPAKDYTADAECLGCHVTGYGKPGGYDPAAPNEHLQGVGCESCHGPGGDFLADDKHSNKNKEFKSADLAQFGFVAKPGEKNCVVCHNDKGPTFAGFKFDKNEGIHDHHALKFEH